MNVIIVMLDSLRPDHVGCYGNKWIKTPNLDQVAKESTIFNRVVPESLPTIPVRRALMTGIRVFPFKKRFFATQKEAEAMGSTFLNTGGPTPGWEPNPLNQKTLAEMLTGLELAGLHWAEIQRLGLTAAYRTAFITDTMPYFSNPAMNFHRGFAHWDWIRGQENDKYGAPVLAKKWDLNRFIPPWFENTWEAGILRKHLAHSIKWGGEEDHFGPRVFRAAIEWLEDSREAEDPFFLLVDCFDPHEPWDPPQKYVDLYDPGYKGVEMIHSYYGSTDRMSEKELKHMRALYAGEVTMVDTWFGKFMDKVHQLGLLDDTLLIITSDHGHLLGEHGISGKVPEALYSGLLDAVLIIRHPRGIGASKISDAFVQHQDICTTILNFAGIKPPHELDGKDLMPILEGRKDKVRDYATSAHAINVLCRDNEYVFISRTKGEKPQLYDMKNDPEQNYNIAADKPQVVKRMFDMVLDDAHGGPILPDYTPNAEVHRCYK